MKKSVRYGLSVGVIAIIALIYIYNCEFHMPKAELNNPSNGYVHFSIDDSNSIFEDLTVYQNEYSSIFEQPILSKLKTLHDKYGIVCSFYVYYSWDIHDESRFTLADATDAFADEFSENASWLRFGFHAIDANAFESLTEESQSLYYEKTVQELLRITGSVQCIDNYVRLDRYICEDEIIDRLENMQNGICGLLCADDPTRQSYSLSPEEMLELYKNDYYVDENGLCYTPTDIRLENVESRAAFYACLPSLNSQTRIIIFTHEWALDDKRVNKYFDWFANYSKQKGYRFSFPEDEELVS